MTVVSIEESLRIERAVSFVYRYLLDASNSSGWDPRISHSVKTTPGPIQTGTHFDIRARWAWFEWPMDMHVIEMVDQQYIETKGMGDHYSVLQRWRFEGDETHCILHYQQEFFTDSVLKHLNPAIQVILRRQASEAMQALESSLNEETTNWQATFLGKIGDHLVVPGMLRFTKLGFNASKAKWKGVCHDLSGKNILITGASSGIGAAAARSLAQRGAHLILVARDEKKTRQIASSLATDWGASVEVELADLSLMRDVQKLCERLREQNKPLYVLINNAGALFRQRQVSPEGLELSFATLLLSPFLLTEGLKPLLTKGSPSRVINVVSGGLYTQGLHLEDLEFHKSDYDGPKAYARMKRGLLDLTEIWAQRWADVGITVQAMHPGWADTSGVAKSLPGFYEFTKNWLRTPEQGADTIVWLAAAKEAVESSGLFWFDRAPHTTAIFPGTKSSELTQQALYETLLAYRQKLLDQTKN